MPKQIIAITDMSAIGSGYYYLFTNLAKGLAKLGHTITVAGLGYMGEPHDYDFSIIPTPMLQDAIGIVNNLAFFKRCDMILVALDIPLQMQIFSTLQPLNKPYMAITPMENGPLVDDWAIALSQMHSVFFISEMAKQEAIRAGVTKAEHLYVGIDTMLWHPPTLEERKQLRSGLGFEENDFVILTVGDNQERKNLWAGMRIIANLKKLVPERQIRYIVVSREDTQVGWKLRSLAKSEGILKEYIPFQRGLPTKDLWGLYACADLYLQPSKAEGLGLPVMEAMACGIPCVATSTGALFELLDNGRGLLVPPEYSFIDVWGNSQRDMIDVEQAAEYIEPLVLKPELSKDIIFRALEYAKSRTWEHPVQQVNQKIAELFNEQTQQAPQE